MRNLKWIAVACILLCFGSLSQGTAEEFQATPVGSIRVQPGFRVELIRSAQKGESSWISMTFDDQGRLILGLDDVGLGRLTLNDDPKQIPFEKIDNTLKHCRGVLYAHNSLYISETNGKGLHRFKDTNGDGQFDQRQLLKKLEYGSRFGHGSNQIVLGPDQNIYLVVGNDVAFPAGVSPNSPYRDPHNDHLLPNPHDAGQDDRVGYILKTDPDGKTWEILAGGFRNQVDMAFNSEGEMFTYDADMEWDVGQPWYRPTRVNHIIQGGEYGWRWGTGKWPEYYADSLPSTLDTGLSSPTGIIFGTDSKFPERFKNSLYIADWQNGRILLVDLIPAGASFTCQYEVFLEGGPLNVCDMQFGPDGALYFITGGRGSQSGLYRVTPTANQKTNSTAPKIDKKTEALALAARKLRQQLEQYQTKPVTDINLLWPHLSSPDRWLRFTTRRAIENQDVSRWRARVLTEINPTAAIAGLIALCHKGTAEDKDPVLTALNRIDLKQLKQQQLLALLRAYELCFIRLDAPTAAQANALKQRLQPLYPHATSSANHLLCDLLVYLKDETVVPQTVNLLTDTSTQEEQIRAARTLTFARQGWNKEQQHNFLTWLAHARTFSGGKQLTERLRDIRVDFLEMLTEQQRQQFSKEIAALDKPLVEEEIVPTRPMVQDWKLDDLEPHLAAVTTNRSFKSGRQALLAASCLKCHRIGSTGAQVGPDLTNVGKRFDSRAILESIITPSKVMDEKYLYTVYILDSGKVVTGRPVGVNKTTITVETDPIKQTTVPVARDEIEESILSKTSPMPASLINVLTKEEILDLLAYLKAGGNPQADAFLKQK
ncbi:heme-binding protein [uncultured Gimesia sp.]|uniref:heme-binding protein n=1 Tax=uncultured Gimesia sp. TaxID=1678688 RepID=UPI0030DAD6AB|tara:strand:+ start:296297 stop:298774 length:2478 start_codon:yes stop_codon:yes gene_type:complete